MNAGSDEETPFRSPDDDIMDEIMAEGARSVHSDAVGDGTDPPSMDPADPEHTLAGSLGADGNLADALHMEGTLEEPHGVDGAVDEPADDGGDIGDSSLPTGGSRPGTVASVRGSMTSIRADPADTAASVRGSMTSVRADPADTAASVRGSMTSVRADPADTTASVRGSMTSIRADPADTAASVRGSMTSVRADPADTTASVRGSMTSVRGSVTSLRGAGDTAAVPAGRPGTSRPPLSAAVRPADTTASDAKTPMKNTPPELSEEPLLETAEEEFQGDNIWAIAEKMNQARILRGIDLSETQSVETTLLFVGSKQAGKSSLIHKFLDREEEPKRTLGLEYSYGRKAGKSVLKDVCHIWELGGGITYTPLLETPLKAERLPNIAIFLVVDLTKPHAMWSTLETMLKTLREGLDAEINSSIGREMKLKERLRSATERRVPSDHQDAVQLQPFPVPLVLVGGRYDTFRDWDPEKKKLICRTLRYLAHVNGAALYFFSPTDSALVKKAKDLMNQLTFGGPASGYLAQDYNKPLLIPAGTDSLAGILGVGADTSYNTAKNTFTAQYPQDTQSTTALPDDPAKDMNYREAEIDQLRAQKDQELERLRRELERRRRWGDEL